MQPTQNNSFPFSSMQNNNNSQSNSNNLFGNIFGSGNKGNSSGGNPNWMSSWLSNLGNNGNQNWFTNWMNGNTTSQNPTYPFSNIQNTPSYNINSKVVTSSNQGQQIADSNKNFVSGYTVQPGNTISQIAGMMGMSVSQLLAYNPQITNPNLIYPGQVIQSAQSYYASQNPGSQGLGGTLTGTQPGPAATGSGAAGVGAGKPGPSTSGATPPPGATSPNSDMSVTPYQQMDFNQFQNNPQVQQFDNYINTLNNLANTNNQMLQDEIASITAQYSSLRNKQTTANQSYEDAIRVLGIREGRTQYAPMVQAGINMAAQSAGIEKLGQIGIQENQALIAARKANNAELHAIVKDLSSLQETKINTIRGMKADLISQTEAQNKQQDRYLANNLPGIYTSLKSLPPDQQQAQLAILAGKMGIDPSVLKSGYYNFQQEQTKGIRNAIESLIAKYPDANISQEAYLNGDMNAIRRSIMASPIYKAELAKATAASSSAGGGILSGLSSGLQGRIIARTDKFSADKTVQRFNVLQEGYTFLNSLIGKKEKSSADDQAFIYQFAKSLDPDSAVREGEYATVKKYSQSLVSRYGNEIKNAINGKGFLSASAKQAIMGTLKSKLDTQNTLYQNVYNQYANQIDNIAGKPGIGEKILNDYSLYTSDNVYGNTGSYLQAPDGQQIIITN